MAKKTNKQLLTGIIVDSQHLMMGHRSQVSRAKRLEREIALLCKNMGEEITSDEIRDILYW